MPKIPATNPSPDDIKSISALLGNSHRRESAALKMIETHLADVDGESYIAWSGGRDSTAAMVLALKISPNIPVVWFHSGLEYPETEEYVHHLAHVLHLNLHIIQAQPSALELLKETGAWDHGAKLSESNNNMHEALVVAPSRVAHKEFGSGEILGLRAGESRGRYALLASGGGFYRRKEGYLVCCPIWQWSAVEVSGFLFREGIAENPVYEKLIRLGAPELAQRVGLLVDGNGVTMGRLTWLRAGWPELFSKLAQELPRLREWR